VRILEGFLIVIGVIMVSLEDFGLGVVLSSGVAVWREE
jgi:hypothetical protein